ncbi:MAG: lipocalin family protein [Chitinophagaceae bacterium]|nr:lipocalin family protein [Chitinophagaceae bacterium]
MVVSILKRCLLLVFTMAFMQVNAQSIVGSWKRLSTTLEYLDGKKEDLQATLVKNMPCVVNTVYIFKADGTHYSQSTKECEMIDKMGRANWQQSGNLLTLEMKNQGNVKTSYTVTFSGNKMILTHLYTAEENKVTGTKVKQLITIYERL